MRNSQVLLDKAHRVVLFTRAPRGFANKTSFARELLSERISQGWIGKTPANRATALIATTVTTLRGYSMSSVKVVHGRQLRTEPARRHGYVHKMWKILLDFFGYLSGSFDHTSFSNENYHFNLDVDQSEADRSYLLQSWRCLPHLKSGDRFRPSCLHSGLI
jgi:hypothetical protein